MYGIINKKGLKVGEQDIPEEENEQSGSNMSQIGKFKKGETNDDNDNISQIPSEIAHLKVSHNNI